MIWHKYMYSAQQEDMLGARSTSLPLQGSNIILYEGQTEFKGNQILYVWKHSCLDCFSLMH